MSQKYIYMKDWIGNEKSIFVCNGASNHSADERQSDDYYATDPRAIDKLCAVERFTPTVWECACGGGHLVNALRAHGYAVLASDIVDRGCPSSYILDFLHADYCAFDIITNPPYRYAKEFVEHALNITSLGCKVAMFLKLTFLESRSRRALFEKYPPKRIWVFSERVQCAKNGDFEKYKKTSTAVAYAWFIWEKGYVGETTVGWI